MTSRRGSPTLHRIDGDLVDEPRRRTLSLCRAEAQAHVADRLQVLQRAIAIDDARQAPVRVVARLVTVEAARPLVVVVLGPQDLEPELGARGRAVARCRRPGMRPRPAPPSRRPPPPARRSAAPERERGPSCRRRSEAWPATVGRTGLESAAGDGFVIGRPLHRRDARTPSRARCRRPSPPARSSDAGRARSTAGAA